MTLSPASHGLLAGIAVASPSLIGDSTYVSLAAAMAIAVAVARAAYVVRGLKDKIEANFEKLSERIKTSETTIQAIGKERTRDIDMLRAELIGGGEQLLHVDEPLFRVLLIEDDPGDQALFSRAMSSMFIVRVARNLGEAVTIFNTWKPDCTVLDLTLPDTSPMDTVRLFRERFPGAVCVAYSGNENPAVMQAATEHGADSYVSKNNPDSNYICRMVKHAIMRRGGK